MDHFILEGTEAENLVIPTPLPPKGIIGPQGLEPLALTFNPVVFQLSSGCHLFSSTSSSKLGPSEPFLELDF